MIFGTARRIRNAIARDQFAAWYSNWKDARPPHRYGAGRALNFWRWKWRQYGQHDNGA